MSASEKLTNKINADLIEVMKSWKEFQPKASLLCFYNPDTKHIVIELIFIPVSLRRQGICGQMIDEITDVARGYGIEIWLEPNDSFGVSKSILSDMYMQYGFSWVDKHWMKKI